MSELDYALSSPTTTESHVADRNYIERTIKKHFEIKHWGVAHIFKTNLEYAEIKKLKLLLSEIEEYTINSKAEEENNCKFLCRFIDTKTLMKNRKEKLLNIEDNLKETFYHNRVPYTTQVKVFHTYLSTNFLYNFELLTFTELLIEGIGNFQRRYLRTCI